MDSRAIDIAIPVEAIHDDGHGLVAEICDLVETGALLEREAGLAMVVGET